MWWLLAKYDASAKVLFIRWLRRVFCELLRPALWFSEVSLLGMLRSIGHGGTFEGVGLV
jgi:hypothetical protein